MDIEYSRFQYVRDAIKELLAYELDRVSIQVINDINIVRKRSKKVLGGNRGRPLYDVQNINVDVPEEFVPGVNVP